MIDANGHAHQGNRTLQVRRRLFRSDFTQSSAHRLGTGRARWPHRKGRHRLPIRLQTHAFEKKLARAKAPPLDRKAHSSKLLFYPGGRLAVRGGAGAMLADIAIGFDVDVKAFSGQETVGVLQALMVP